MLGNKTYEMCIFCPTYVKALKQKGVYLTGQSLSIPLLIFWQDAF